MGKLTTELKWIAVSATTKNLPVSATTRACSLSFTYFKEYVYSNNKPFLVNDYLIIAYEKFVPDIGSTSSSVRILIFTTRAGFVVCVVGET